MAARKILVVEDDESVRNFIRINLEFEGYQVSVAENGRAALDWIEKEKPELVITDLMMPEMDGVALYKTLKASEETRSIPILVLTVKDSFDDVHHAFMIGVEDYLTKPFDPKLLLLRVHEIFS